MIIATLPNHDSYSISLCMTCLISHCIIVDVNLDIPPLMISQASMQLDLYCPNCVIPTKDSVPIIVRIANGYCNHLHFICTRTLPSSSFFLSLSHGFPFLFQGRSRVVCGDSEGVLGIFNWGIWGDNVDR